jgi:hypothetical protein
MDNYVVERALIVKGIVDRYYESGRQDRNLSWVYRNVVRKQIPISYRTFFRYLKIIKNNQK